MTNCVTNAQLSTLFFAQALKMELKSKVEKEPSVLSNFSPVWKRRLITKSSIATVEETQVLVIALRRGEARDCKRRFLCFIYLILILGRVAPRGGGLPYRNDESARRTF